MLCLHDVEDSVWLERFFARLIGLRKLISLPQLVEQHRTGQLEAGVCAVTFDDGYRSAAEVVLPAAEAHGVPFALFCCSSMIESGEPLWIERLSHLVQCHTPREVAVAMNWTTRAAPTRLNLYAYCKEQPIDKTLAELARAESVLTKLDSAPSCRYLDLAQLQLLARSPLVTIGGHTHRHAILSRETPQAQRGEIVANLLALRGWIGQEIKLFAYPNGTQADFDRETRRILIEEGVIAAFTTRQARLRAADDAMALPRVGVKPGESIYWPMLKYAIRWPSLGYLREGMARRSIATARHHES